mmetsp:Transcript_4670/g.5592  ORF Transcript_4670/g.5592 Transcript_4670/m.5592 type:complete len:133 (-) Transcript_4670:1036-1434(-)|eukprot:CAMPEP_0185746002 /NCGR_PEP_ID=MMETSP1174-20130828/4392_1 /TAXON_ID=35687 /ORGANISM="Dictyocha speculum, Strain CCMP1381" /LENGTH=132 /DNA_ID=CAMNT_0028420329 /DNA_START=62 /DNA_END=460 /DNA_ORIENTATION=-
MVTITVNGDNHTLVQPSEVIVNQENVNGENPQAVEVRPSKSSKLSSGIRTPHQPAVGSVVDERESTLEDAKPGVLSSSEQKSFENPVDPPLGSEVSSKQSRLEEVAASWGGHNYFKHIWTQNLFANVPADAT